MLNCAVIYGESNRINRLRAMTRAERVGNSRNAKNITPRSALAMGVSGCSRGGRPARYPSERLQPGVRWYRGVRTGFSIFSNAPLSQTHTIHLRKSVHAFDTSTSRNVMASLITFLLVEV